MLESLLSGYSITHVYENESGYDYFGYTHKDDSWRIMRVNTDGTEYLFAIGGTNYIDAINNRATHDYKMASQFK